MAFTAKDVQALRASTGCGMMDCKKALTASDGDMDKAIEFLREKGLAAAAKKASRIAAEGLVDAYVDMEQKVGVLVEVNAETDFVAKNAEFQKFVDGCAVTIAKQNPASVEALLEMNYEGSDRTVADNLRDKILTIGENMTIRRFERYEGAVVTYLHGAGKIGVMVLFDADASLISNEKFIAMGKDVAMQIAAMNAPYLNRESVPSDIIEKEKEILTAQAINEGKPANIAEKMVAGRINKYYKENCLVDQVFVKDDSMTIGQYVEKCAKEIGSSISIKAFSRFERGEGLEKRQDDFAGEIASMVK